MEFAGRVAAATLGYIHNDLRGAYKATKYYNDYIHRKKLSTMPPIPRKTNDQNKVTKRRRTTAASTRPSKSSKKSRSTQTQTNNKTSFNSKNPEGTRQIKVVRKGKALATKKNPKVTVSKIFKAKVEKALSHKSVYGYFQSVQFDPLYIGQFSNTQKIDRFPNTIHNLAGSLFHPCRILHVANRLFSNNVPATIDPIFPISGSIVLDRFDATKVKINVVKQWWSFTAKNNTNRTMNIRLYQAKSRKNAISDPAGGDPVQCWERGLQERYNDESLKSNATSTGLTTPGYPQTSYLGLLPSASFVYQRNWKDTSSKIVVEPGQSFTWNVTGPSMVYDFAKFWDNDNFMVFIKDDIWQFAVTTLDQASSELDNTVDYHIPWIGTDDGHRLLIMGKYHCKIEMPDMTGGDVITHTDTTLSRRHRVDCYDDFTPGPAKIGDIDRVDENLTAMPDIVD